MRPRGLSLSGSPRSKVMIRVLLDKKPVSKQDFVEQLDKCNESEKMTIGWVVVAAAAS